MANSPPSVNPEVAVDRLRQRGRGARWMLGIAGSPGAGKSTLARRVEASFGASVEDGGAAGGESCVLVPMDGFHLAQRVLDAAGLADRKGAPETFDRAGYVALLERVRAQRPGDPTVYAPEFRRDLEEPIAGAIAVPAHCPVVVTEGNYLLHWPEVRPLLDEVWWVEIDRAERLRRLTARHERHGKPPAQAHAWAHGTDERNARAIAGGREVADLVVTFG